MQYTRNRVLVAGMTPGLMQGVQFVRPLQGQNDVARSKQSRQGLGQALKGRVGWGMRQFNGHARVRVL
jgi:hypothetical protein